MSNPFKNRWSTLSACLLAVVMAVPGANATELDLSQVPLFLSPAVAPLNLLVVGRDHKLYYEAYNDASDLDNDGVIDVGYRGYVLKSPAPTEPKESRYKIDYYGYFDSYKCYVYALTQFNPTRETANKQCGGAGEWSGDFLNYVTMARIDALRKVLYGGKRVVDTAAATVLERTHVPMDAHSWAKEYTSVAVDGFDIRQYAPYSAPAGGLRHLFANVTENVLDSQWYDNNRSPKLRILTSVPYRKWEWVSKESPDAGTIVSPPTGNVTVAPLDLEVRVAVCVSAALIGKESCQRYPSGNLKPIGLLHEFGENGSMLFGLLTGSYTANKSGGVLRKNIGSFADEINTMTDGTLTSTLGIIHTLDHLRVAAYTRYTGNGGTSYDCGLPAMAHGAPTDGSCRMWGNPVAEMMYEGLRYFGGAAPTPAFTAIYGTSNTDIESAGRLNLPRPNWLDPYSSAPLCAKPFETVMADINNSYDSDQLPGSVFPLEVGSNAISDPLPGLNVATLADKITSYEPDVAGLHFIGQSGTGVGSYDGAPTPKTVASLSTIRGLAPEEPTKQGGYYAASVAYHGLSNPVHSGSNKTVQTFAVALASPLPKIEIPVGGRTITLVPFAKSVKYGTEIDRAQGAFQPTNQIVDFYIESLAADRTSGTFQVNFEDVEAGNDHDMDAITRYSYQVSGNTVTVDLSSDYQAGGIIHHIGYIISGTDHDGVYLDVQDCNKSGGVYNCNGDDPDYFLDTPQGKFPGEAPFDGVGLPGSSTRTFVPSSSAAATLLKDPLWYAAKWGGFKDSNGDGIPDVQSEWDTDPFGTPGYNVPDNYFLVTNALTLSEQLRNAFDEITKRNASATAASVNSGAISTDTNVYQASFDTVDWTGKLKAFPIDPATGVVSATALWDASTRLPSPASRQIITVNADGTAVPFQWTDLDATRQAQLSADATTGAEMVAYLRGDAAKEKNPWRVRATKLGDIISSSPLYVGPPRMRYDDALESAAYSTFAASNLGRRKMVYAGANDGMLHGFDAEDGSEVFAFIPKTVFPNLNELPKSTYTHQYYVDGATNSGDVFYGGAWHSVLVGGLNRGGQGIYALNVTDPSVLSGAEGAPGQVFLWEFNDQSDRDLGYTYSQPAIVRLHDGSWAAVFGNGYNSTTPDGTASLTGNAVLYVVNIATGAIIRKFDTGVGTTADPTGTGRPNGLATPVMVDTDGDRVIDHAYAGDLFGNLWKFDLRSNSAASWDFAFRDALNKPQPFFTARDGATPSHPQPITVRPEVARGRYGAGVMVLFGTGKFLETDDKQITPTRVQSFYGLLDQNTFTPSDRIASRASLVRQTIDSETTVGTRSYRTTSNLPLTGNGWYLDLQSPVHGYEGERAVTDPTVRDGRVFFSTLSPASGACTSGGKSWIMFLDLLSGGRLPEAQVDTNGDGKIDNSDQSTSGFGNDALQTRVELLMCLDGSCAADRLLSSGSDGELLQENVRKNSRIQGRQSWRKIR
jgi:type IV pilus assembly protein PilY1